MWGEFSLSFFFSLVFCGENREENIGNSQPYPLNVIVELHRKVRVSRETLFFPSSATSTTIRTITISYSFITKKYGIDHRNIETGVGRTTQFLKTVQI